MLGKDRGRSAHHSGDLQEDFPKEVTFEPGPTRQRSFSAKPGWKPISGRKNMACSSAVEGHSLFGGRGTMQCVWDMTCATGEKLKFKKDL